MSVPIDEQIQCIERELGYRDRVYKRRIAEGKMTQRLADREMERMRAVLETLQGLHHRQIEHDADLEMLGSEAELFGGQIGNK